MVCMNLPPLAECAETVLKNAQTQYAEIEFRLGHKNQDMFDPNVGEDVFKRVKARLDRFTEWEKVVHTDDEVYYWPTQIRYVYNESAQTSVCIRKDKVSVSDVKMEPLDVRLAVSREVPAVLPKKEATRRVVRKRTSYIRKNVSIDLTEVQGNTGDIDDERNNVFQIEIEVISPAAVSSVHDAYTILWKVSDVLKICV